MTVSDKREEIRPRWPVVSVLDEVVNSRAFRCGN